MSNVRAQVKTIIARLREVNEPVPLPLALPTEVDIENVERALQTSIPADLKVLVLEAGDVVYGTYEPITFTPNSGHTFAVVVVRDAWSSGVPRNLFPFCESNGDYFCLSNAGEVVYWSHQGESNERWPSLESWVRNVWLASGVP